MKPSMRRWRLLLLLLSFGLFLPLSAQTAAQVVDIPTRPGVTQRFIYLAPDNPRAAAIPSEITYQGALSCRSDALCCGSGRTCLWPGFLSFDRRHPLEAR